MRKIFFVLMLCAVFFVACAGVPTESEIPETLTVPELMQEAQNNIDRGNPNAAKVYFSVILHRFEDDAAAVVGAEYELAHLKIKEKNWQDAIPMIDAIIEKYDNDVYYQLPRAYLKLALLDKEKIPQKEVEKWTGAAD